VKSQKILEKVLKKKHPKIVKKINIFNRFQGHKVEVLKRQAPVGMTDFGVWIGDRKRSYPSTRQLLRQNSVKNHILFGRKKFG